MGPARDRAHREPCRPRSRLRARRVVDRGHEDPARDVAGADLPIMVDCNCPWTVDEAIAMARTPDPHSASSQFFINVADNDFLNFSAPTAQGWGYCVFGKVTAGTEVVDKIAKVINKMYIGCQELQIKYYRVQNIQ